MAPGGQCGRCREWVSLDLDAELSEFEAVVMRRHVRSCADCRSFARELSAATALVRDTAPAEFESAALEAAVTRPSRPGRTRATRLISQHLSQRISLGIAVAAVSLVWVFASGVPSDQRPGRSPSGVIANVDLASVGSAYAYLEQQRVLLRQR